MIKKCETAKLFSTGFQTGRWSINHTLLTNTLIVKMSTYLCPTASDSGDATIIHPLQTICRIQTQIYPLGLWTNHVKKK